MTAHQKDPEKWSDSENEDEIDGVSVDLYTLREHYGTTPKSEVPKLSNILSKLESISKILLVIQSSEQKESNSLTQKTIRLTFLISKLILFLREFKCKGSFELRVCHEGTLKVLQEDSLEAFCDSCQSKEKMSSFKDAIFNNQNQIPKCTKCDGVIEMRGVEGSIVDLEKLNEKDLCILSGNCSFIFQFLEREPCRNCLRILLNSEDEFGFLGTYRKNEREILISSPEEITALFEALDKN